MDTLEAVIAVYIVRFGVVLAALGLSIANWVRTSRLQRERFSIPEDLSANVKRLRHEVESVDESLRVHSGKEAARVGRADKKEEDRLAAERLKEAERLAAVNTLDVSPPASEAPAISLTAAQVKLGLSRALTEANAKRRTRRSA